MSLKKARSTVHLGREKKVEGSKHCKHLYTEDDRGGNWGGGEKGGVGGRNWLKEHCVERLGRGLWSCDTADKRQIILLASLLSPLICM